MTSTHDFTVTTIDGTQQSLADYAGKALLVVNTASKCGLTGQYEGLQKLYDTYGSQGLVVLGFPCDQFGHQEPGDESEIATFCSLNYSVTFPMFAKINVNGSDADPLYTYLKSQASGFMGSAIKWNFTKFLVDQQGQVVSRYAPKVAPEALSADIEKLLG